MAKKNTKQPKTKKTDDHLTLQDTLNQDILLKLKQAQQQLKDEEETKKLKEAERKREERRQKEKNKSFEELLNESSMDWKKYKQ
ncbi:YqkE family protein [Heyndrickxia vini]|uniref:YqkE family protein n=1 Tax=Heyndrickxia vini TaxID=1476025 RepID=A0ABX7E6U7_9BACI|nr:YqkE family protein [Heyndrickxia vini]QQZ10946.1 YqkE family protein [Heyndrickxia vini]